LTKAEKDWIIVEEKLQFFQDKENVDGDNFFLKRERERERRKERERFGQQ
jgi:hypothetical protein